MKKLLSKDIGKIQINQRRYLGNKYGVLSLIERVISKEIGTFDSLCDIFAGTGVVGYNFNDSKTSIISNDILYCNYVVLYAWLSEDNYSLDRITGIIEALNNLEPTVDNYVSKHFGGRYFIYENALKIGAIREEIEKLDISFKEKSILLTSLLYAMDKVANTVGHYDAYREKMDTLQSLELCVPEIKNRLNKNNLIFNKDSNKLIEELSCDILYIDPPYNSRQYCDTYHVLENVARWNKPPVYGKAKKFDRSALKSLYNRKEAPRAFKELVDKADCKYILFSYNSTGKNGHSRSNAKISDEEIISILTDKGKIKVFEQDYKMFSAGKTEFSGNKERIFFCEVKNG